MEAKDESQINRILANPPVDLYDMIHSVFNRLSRGPEIDVEVANRLLAWVAFARRPLSFGELDVILRLGSSQTNWFLWDHVRGIFSSIFRLRYPNRWNAEDVDNDDNLSTYSDDGRGQVSSSKSQNDDDNSSLGDFIGDDNDETEVTDEEKSDGDEEADRSPHSESPKISEADQRYTWAQKHTVVDFSHQRFRDFLVQEGDPGRRLKEPLPITIDIHNVDLQLVMEGFEVLRAAPGKGMFLSTCACETGPCTDLLQPGEFIENYVAYPAFHIFSHLAAVDKARLDDATKAHILKQLYWLMRTFASRSPEYRVRTQMLI